jgi:DNA-directed RNA polymerase subunit F
MIHQNEPLSMAESLEYIKDANTTKFIKTFVNLKPEKAKQLRKEIEKLDLIKLNPRHISKIIDCLPEDKESLNKILVDISLDENESNKILQTIKDNK